MNKEFDEYCERIDRACDALVLAYRPDEPLARVYGKNFYIPSCSRVEEAFGEALRNIFGSKEGGSHWADSVKWNTIANLRKLEERILEGTQEVICGDPDYQTIFESYLSSIWEKFDSTWIYGKGSLYRFREGKREIALEKFEAFWNKEEKLRWRVIHRFMREYTKCKYSKK